MTEPTRKKMFRAILLIALCVQFTPAEARIKRSQSAKVEFKHDNPCPANGERKGPCKGYIMDHRIGLCVGGPDVAANLRWMTVETAKAKDRWECRPGWEQKLQECEAKECFVEN